MRRKLLWAAIPSLMFLGFITSASWASAGACGRQMIGPEDGGTFSTQADCVQQGEWSVSIGASDCYSCSPVPYNGGIGFKLGLFYAR